MTTWSFGEPTLPADDEAVAQRRAVVIAGHTGGHELIDASLSHADPSVRIAAIGAADRQGQLDDAQLMQFLGDPHGAVRRRAAHAAALRPTIDLGALLHDAEPRVVEVAAWAIGEQENTSAAPFDALIGIALGHDDALCRESAVATLGALQDERGRAAILQACGDKATVRRRAVLALASFEGADVDQALDAAKNDRDWQVRQAAEDLSS